MDNPSVFLNNNDSVTLQDPSKSRYNPLFSVGEVELALGLVIPSVFTPQQITIIMQYQNAVYLTKATILKVARSMDSAPHDFELISVITADRSQGNQNECNIAMFVVSCICLGG